MRVLCLCFLSIRTADRAVAKQLFMTKRSLEGWEVMFSFISHQKVILVCEETLRTLFSSFGEVLDCVIRSYNRNDNAHLVSSKLQNGYGFVEFKDKVVAEFVVANIKSSSFVPLPTFVRADVGKDDVNEVQVTVNLDCSFSRRSMSRMSEVKSPEVPTRSSQRSVDVRVLSLDKSLQPATAASVLSTDSRPYTIPPMFPSTIPIPPTFSSTSSVQIQPWQISDSLAQYTPISGSPYLVMTPPSYYPSHPQQFASSPLMPMNAFPVPVQAPYVLHSPSVPSVQSEPTARSIYVPASQQATTPNVFPQYQQQQFVVSTSIPHSNDYHPGHADQSLQLPPSQYAYLSPPGPTGYYSQYFYPRQQPSIPHQHQRHQIHPSSFTTAPSIPPSMSAVSSNLSAEQIMAGYPMPGTQGDLSRPPHPPSQSQDVMNRFLRANNQNFQFER